MSAIVAAGTTFLNPYEETFAVPADCEDDQIIWIVPGAYGPSVMAIVVTGLADGGQGIRGLLSKLLIWRVNIGWFLAVLLVIRGSTTTPAGVS